MSDEFKLPTKFDPAIFANKYHQIKNVKTTKNSKAALKWIKTKLNIDLLTIEKLQEIDETIAKLRKNDYEEEKYSKKTVASYCGRVLNMLSTLFVFHFEVANASIPTIVMRDTDVPEDRHIPANLSGYYKTDNEFYKEILKIRDIVFYKRNFRDSYRKDLMYEIKSSMYPLSKYFIDNTITRQQLVEHIQKIENSYSDNKRISRNMQINSTTISYAARTSISFFNFRIDSNLYSSLKNENHLHHKEIIAKKKEVIQLEHDYFTDDELKKISDVYENAFEQLIFEIFLNTGMRGFGVRNIKVKHLFDDNLNVKTNGETIEKGNKIRKFVIFPPLKHALEKYKTEYKKLLCGPEYYLFPASFNASYTKSIHATTIYDTVRKVCKRANITGHHIHAHALRKTVIVNLMKTGNHIDNVAKFIGHSCAEMTARHYWVATQDDLASNMNLSWFYRSSKNENLKTSICEKNCVTKQKFDNVFSTLNKALSLMTTKQLKKMQIETPTENKDMHKLIAELIEMK